MIKIKYANSPKKLQSELIELNKVHVVKKKPHEIKQEILVDITGEFEVVGNLSLGDQIRETQIRFRNVDVFASYVKPSMKGMKQKMPFLMVKSIKSIVLNLRSIKDVNMEMVVILNMNFLNIEVIIVLFQLKFFVLSEVLFS